MFENFSEGYIPGLLVCAICPTVTQLVDNAYRILSNNGAKSTRTFDFSTWDNIYLIIGYGDGILSDGVKQLKIDELFTNWLISIVHGSTAPSTYIPYGYKLPLTSAGQDVDIFIGDDTLSAEEYIDSGTGKIYRMVDGVLTPTDPPLPLPQIPTTANSTTISWAGEGLAPSEFDSVQEWVDIPTYKRVNGEWVADN